MMIISPEANETEIDAASARVAGFIADRGGLIYEQSNWGLRRLAYPIQKFQEGNYVLTRFALEPAEIIELDTSLKASDDVMRHLTMKLDKSVKVEVPELEPEAEPVQAEEAEAEASDPPVAQAEAADVEADTLDAPVAEAETTDVEAETSDAPVAEAETTDVETETSDAPVAEAETTDVEVETSDAPVAEAENEVPAEPAAQPEAEAAAEVETPDEPVTKGGGEQ